MDREQRPEDGNQILFGLGNVHRVQETAEGKVEELLHHLVADHPIACICGLPNQPVGSPGFGWRLGVKGIGKDVRIEEESSAHSSRLWYRVLTNERGEDG